MNCSVINEYGNHIQKLDENTIDQAWAFIDHNRKMSWWRRLKTNFRMLRGRKR